MCWLDLANAYGSVNHGLIDFTLQHYHASSRFRNTVSNLYSDLNVVVTTPTWSTRPIPLRVGVYQGDPLSVVIFNSVMSTLGESLKQYQQLGYSFSNSPRSLTTLQYADDTCLVADGPSSCQKLLQQVDRWLDWAGMRAKVPKCHSLAIHATSGKPYDPKLTLQGAAVPSIGHDPVKFLGAFIQIPQDQQRVRGHLQDKLLGLLQKVDSTPVTRNQKLLLYKAGICPRLLWDLGTSDLPISWVTKCLETTATRFLKRWSGLARSADPSRLYLQKKNGGLNLPNITTIYKKAKVSIACQLLTSHDPITRHISKISIGHEESQKRAKFQPMLTAREVMADDPGARRGTLTKRSKNLVVTEDNEKRLEHARSLVVQGQLHLLDDTNGASLWSDVVQALPPECMKFALNAAQDTLPHNANLSVWMKEAGLSDQCKLCNHRQTLLHVLNHCQVALELRRYNQRHDNILRVIVESLQNQCQPEYKITADLPNTSYNFPPTAASTDLRPDLVVWNDSQRVLVLAELTVCFETNFEDASQRKRNKYQDLLETCQASGYTTHLITLEVGSRGFVNFSGFQRFLKFFSFSRKDTLSLLKSVAREAIIQSHRIWTSRNTTD